MDDIKLSELGIVDYIPEDEKLCVKCVHWDECPYDYRCPSLKRLIEYLKENGEL